MKNTVLLIPALFVLFVASSTQAQDYVIIVNEANPVESIAKSDLSKLFLKKVSKFDNGTKAVPVDQISDSSVREQFSSDVLSKTVSATKSYWSQQLFSGAGVPPEEKSSDAGVISFVKSNPGAIGYISAAADLAGVKVVSIQ
jgi:ABC-type phosphate transport system substrate-binding protein